MIAHPGREEPSGTEQVAHARRQAMNEFTHEDRGRLSRQQAAERLTDIAYALTAGGPLKLADDDETAVPVADQVVLRLESTYDDGEVEFAVTLSWSIAEITRNW